MHGAFQRAGANTCSCCSSAWHTAGELDPATADKWIVAANDKNPRWNKTVKNHIADSFLRYKGVEAGTVDWRPTETIPEDFYAM